MKNSILFLLVLMCQKSDAQQSHVGLEQYCYFSKNQEMSMVSIAYFQSKKNWYGEARYNYEEKNTISLYAGKTFTRDGQISYAATPMAGLLLGQFCGGSVGINLDMSLSNFEISTQVQYVVCKDDRTKNFLLSWSELGYQVCSHVKSGIVMQQSNVYGSPFKPEPGFFTALNYKNWELPLYIFSPFTKGINYVIGLSWGWDNSGKSNSSPMPSRRQGRQVTVE